jgi:hypothetical protein
MKPPGPRHALQLGPYFAQGESPYFAILEVESDDVEAMAALERPLPPLHLDQVVAALLGVPGLHRQRLLAKQFAT